MGKWVGGGGGEKKSFLVPGFFLLWIESEMQFLKITKKIDPFVVLSSVCQSEVLASITIRFFYYFSFCSKKYNKIRKKIRFQCSFRCFVPPDPSPYSPPDTLSNTTLSPSPVLHNCSYC